MTLYTENVSHQTDHFADAFVHEKYNAYGCDVRKYTADAILFREIECKKMEKYNVLAAFSVRFVLE